MADAAAALRHSTSYRVVGQLDDQLTVSLTVTPNGTRGTVTSHGITWQDVELHGKVWFRGSQLWRNTVSRAKARGFGNRWVLVRDKAAGFGWRDPLSDVQVAIPTVFFAPKGDMVSLGTRTIDGRSVVRIKNGPDYHDVLASGTPYPIDWLETDEPGPDGQPCGVTLSDFNSAITVTAPTTSLVDS
ncbi:MAG TPA: hypothetical protein VHV79_00130 [Mycobacteriales bacterium]|jgi:hypothetical protein|nr:hypothetical protein [Mycobacteriales bacterium]